MTDGYISDRELKCSDCYIRNSCAIHPSTCNKQLHVFDAEGLKIHDDKVRADALMPISKIIYEYACSEEITELDALIRIFDSITEQLKEQK